MKELLEFLIDKCQKGLKEAKEKCVDTQLKGELEEIERVLKRWVQNIASFPSSGKAKDGLYNLISMLTDITTPHKHPAQILCVPLQIRSRRQTRKNLQQIRTQLENLGLSEGSTEKSLDGKKEEGGPSKTSSRRRICKILPCLKQSIGQGTNKRSPNQNEGLASSEPAGGGGIQENSSSSGGKEVSFKPEGWPKSEEKILRFDKVDKLVETIVGRLVLKNRSGHVEIGILGMCGSGKTTLARRICSHSSVDEGFEHLIWVSLPHVSKQRDFNQILRFILTECGVYQSDMDKYEKQPLLRIVRENLLGKNYLLVLDGLWDADIKWYFELSEALDWQYKYGDLGDDKSKSAVIVITRQEEAAKTMVGISGLQLHPIAPDSDTWSIFINKLNFGISDLHQTDSPRDEDKYWSRFINKLVELRYLEIGDADEVKDEIMKQCDGLPLAAVTLAEIFSTLIDRQSNTLPAVTGQQQHAASSNPLTPSATITSGDIAPPTSNNRGGAE